MNKWPDNWKAEDHGLPDWTYKETMERLNSSDENERGVAEDVFFKGHKWISINADQQRYEEGDRAALMHALMLSIRWELKPPKWLKHEFLRSYDKVLSYRAGSWDDAFGTAFAKGTHVEKLRNRRVLGPQIYSRIKHIRNCEANTPMDDGLFERVGEEFGVGKTLVKDLYYKTQKQLPRKI